MQADKGAALAATEPLPGFKRLNLCNAVNDALAIAMDTNERCIVYFLFNELLGCNYLELSMFLTWPALFNDAQSLCFWRRCILWGGVPLHRWVARTLRKGSRL